MRRIAVAFGLEIEQGGAVLGAVEFVGDGLIDRDGDGLGRRIGLVAAVDGDCFSFHVFPPRICAMRRHCMALRFLIRG